MSVTVSSSQATVSSDHHSTCDPPGSTTTAHHHHGEHHQSSSSLPPSSEASMMSTSVAATSSSSSETTTAAQPARHHNLPESSSSNNLNNRSSNESAATTTAADDDLMTMMDFEDTNEGIVDRQQQPQPPPLLSSAGDNSHQHHQHHHHHPVESSSSSTSASSSHVPNAGESSLTTTGDMSSTSNNNTDDNGNIETTESNPAASEPSSTHNNTSATTITTSSTSSTSSSSSIPVSVVSSSSIASLPQSQSQPPLLRSASLLTSSTVSTATSGQLVRSNSATAAPLPPPSEEVKTEPESPGINNGNGNGTNAPETLPDIRNTVVSHHSPASSSQNQQNPPSLDSASSSAASSQAAAPSSGAPNAPQLGMPSMLSTSGPTASITVSSHHHHQGQSHQSHHAPTHLMDTYHHHHSPGPLGLAPPLHGGGGGGGGGNHGGPHTPQQTILSMSPSLGHSMSNVSVVTVASSSPSSDPKECIEEQCPVCGDRVSGYHYGLLTCESCKGFFKRTVQNKKVYTCVAERSCHIDKSQRKRCPYCRFQKCLEVGMKLEAVRADRMRGGRNKFGPMYKRDRARRLQILRQKQITKVHHMGGHHGGGGGGGHHHHLNPPGATMLPGGELNFLNSGHPNHHTTTIFDGVKQELIQIPQLSSSTSSPDSSPSPGSTGPGSQIPGGPLSAAAAAAAAAAAVAAGGHGGGGGGSGGGPLGGGGHPSQHHTNHSFMPQLSISAHPMGQPNNNNSNAQNSGSTNPNLMNPAAAAAAAAADHLLKSWANGGSNGGGGGLPGTSKAMSQYHDGTTAPASNTMAPGNKYMPQLVREFQSSMIDDKEWQAQLFGLLQNQTYNQCEVDLFELMCKVIDQSLFSQVDWARNSIFFKELKVDDQMKLLQHAWSDMLVLDHIHQRMHVGLPDESTLPNGQKFDLLSLALLGVPQVVDQLHRVTARLGEIKVDANDYICLKFLLLLNPDVRGLTNYKLVTEAHEQTKQALLEYTVNFYPQIGDKFQQILALVPEIRALTLRGEDFLYYKHINGSAPTQTLLMEMLHAKKK